MASVGDWGLRSLQKFVNILLCLQARLNQDEEQFLVNPWGMLYHEVTASSLVKVDMQANTIEGGTTNFGVNREGFKLHAAIHSARPDIKCIIHTHTSSVVAVSTRDLHFPFSSPPTIKSKHYLQLLKIAMA